MRIQFISDLHYQSYKNVLLKTEDLEELNSLFSFGLTGDNKTYNQDGKEQVILLIGGDTTTALFKNSLFEDEYELPIFLKAFVNLYLNKNDISVEEILYIEGNHEFYGNYELFDPLFEGACKEVFNLIPKKLEAKPVIIEDKLFLGNKLYNSMCSVDSIQDIEESIQKEYNKEIGQLNDSSYVDKYVKDLPRKYFFFEDDIELNNLAIYFDSIKADLITPFNIARYLFLYNLLTVFEQLKEETLKPNFKSIKEFNFAFHFPFEIKGDIVQEELKFDKVFLKKVVPYKKDILFKWFNVDISWLLFLLKRIESYEHIEKINLFSGHTHESYRLKGTYKSTKIEIVNNSIGFGFNYGKQLH